MPGRVVGTVHGVHRSGFSIVGFGTYHLTGQWKCFAALDVPTKVVECKRPIKTAQITVGITLRVWMLCDWPCQSSNLRTYLMPLRVEKSIFSSELVCTVFIPTSCTGTVGTNLYPPDLIKHTFQLLEIRGLCSIQKKEAYINHCTRSTLAWRFTPQVSGIDMLVSKTI